MSMTNINLKDLYFEYKVLPIVVGEPTFKVLHEILKQLKANTSTVSCMLGGGASGYLGMLVSTAKYDAIAPGTPFVPPTMPGALTILPTDTQYQIATQYETALHEHQTYILMQRALISLIHKCIEGKYTNAVRSRITGQLPTDIRVIMNHLFTTYGAITEHELQEKYDETLKITYNVTEPIDEIFNAVKDLCEVADAIQQVHIGYIIVRKQRVFRGNVRRWMRKLTVEKTWNNFMDHFRTAYEELRYTDATIDELGYHSDHAIIEKIVDRLREEDPDTTEKEPTYQPAMAPTPPVQDQTLPPTSHQANAVVDPNVAVMEQMTTNMTTILETLNHNGGSQGQGYGRAHGRGYGRGYGREHGRGYGREYGRGRGRG